MTLLWIYIANLNRSRFIGATLNSILDGLPADVEIVVVDGASVDGTAQIMAGYVATHDSIRYFRESANSGVDKDYDKSITYARGRYCWLMCDDDVIMKGGIRRVCDVLDREDPNLLVVDAEIRDITLSKKFERQRLEFRGKRNYGRENKDAFMFDAGSYLSYIGGVIIKREVWLGRVRDIYFGTLFVHVGVIFQHPPIDNIIVLGKSLIAIRAGNSMWRPRGFEIFMFKWPDIIWSFDDYSTEARNKAAPRQPWDDLFFVCYNRALGIYTIGEFNKNFRKTSLTVRKFLLLLIALAPGRPWNFGCVAYKALRGRALTYQCYEMAVSSRFSNWASRKLLSFWLDGSTHMVHR